MRDAFDAFTIVLAGDVIRYDRDKYVTLLRRGKNFVQRIRILVGVFFSLRCLKAKATWLLNSAISFHCI